ncbi:MAG TPA: Rho termination factor N-terminal domain-containing protein [Candidatus Saccharimonadales bacterium]|nr:Rho termination factor N-terminal domain-containing protein [Candidatus Saccharimonadales bacterium]
MELSDLEKKTVNELREMARQYDDVEGVVGMKKDHLIDVLCGKLGIEKKHALPKGIGRRALKDRIRTLKSRRDQALTAKDHKALKRARAMLRRTKHRLRDVVEHAARLEAAMKKKSTPPPEAAS